MGKRPQLSVYILLMGSSYMWIYIDGMLGRRVMGVSVADTLAGVDLAGLGLVERDIWKVWNM